MAIRERGSPSPKSWRIIDVGAEFRSRYGIGPSALPSPNGGALLLCALPAYPPQRKPHAGGLRPSELKEWAKQSDVFVSTVNISLRRLTYFGPAKGKTAECRPLTLTTSYGNTTSGCVV